MNERKNMSEEKRLQQLMDVIEAGHELTDEDIDMMMPNEEAMHIFEDITTARNAQMQKDGEGIPDVNEEWEHLSSKLDTPHEKKISHRRVFLWGALSGVAASIAIAFVGIWISSVLDENKGFVAYEMSDDIQQVVLNAGNGEPIVLDNNAKEQQLSELNCHLDKKGTLELEYSKKSDKDEVQIHQLATPKGKDCKLVLADGTTVWLNAESRLEYPSRFIGSQRVVSLHGEAYFKVAKDSRHPFIIRGDRVNACVTGTELNVRNYSIADSHVALIEGKVSVARVEGGEPVHLKPGEEAQLEGNSFKVKNIDTDYYRYWRDGYEYFDGVPLVDIMKSIGRWYNLNIVFENKKQMNIRLRFFYVRNNSVEAALENLNKMKKFSVRRDDNIIYIK